MANQRLKSMFCAQVKLVKSSNSEDLPFYPFGGYITPYLLGSLVREAAHRVRSEISGSKYLSTLEDYTLGMYIQAASEWKLRSEVHGGQPMPPMPQPLPQMSPPLQQPMPQPMPQPLPQPMPQPMPQAVPVTAQPPLQPMQPLPMQPAAQPLQAQFGLPSYAVSWLVGHRGWCRWWSSLSLNLNVSQILSRTLPFSHPEGS